MSKQNKTNEDEEINKIKEKIKELDSDNYVYT